MGWAWQIRWMGQISVVLCLEQGLVKKCSWCCGNIPSPLRVRDSSSLMKLEDDARYVLLFLCEQTITFSLSPLFSLSLAVVYRQECWANQTNCCGPPFFFQTAPALWMFQRGVIERRCNPAEFETNGGGQDCCWTAIVLTAVVHRWWR